MRIVSAIAGLTDAQAGIRGSFLFKILARAEDGELFFLRLTFNPQHEDFMPTHYVGKQNPKNDPEFEQTVSLMRDMLTRRRKTDSTDIRDQLSALLMAHGATKDEIMEAMPDETMAEIYERLKKVLSLYHTDLLYTRPNNRRKKVYTEKLFGQVFIDHLGGIKEFGEQGMQTEISRFKATYKGVYLKKLI